MILLYLLLRKPAKAVPTIPGLSPRDPVKGNIVDIGAAGTMNAFQEKYHAKFGGIFSFWYGDKLVVSLAHPDYMKDIAHLDHRPGLLFEFVKDWIGPESIQFSNGEEYQRRKKTYVDPAFGYRAILQYEHEIVSIYFQEAFPAWRATAGQPQDLKKLCLSLAIKTITQVAFGNMQSSPTLIDTFLHCYNVIWSHVYSRVQGTESPVGEVEYRKKLEEMRGMCREMVESRKKANISEPYRFIDLLTKGENPDLIASEMISFFVGGFHTTGYTMIWVLYYLARHPQEQDRVRAALDAHIPKSQVYVSSRDLPIEKFKVLYNFVEETLRLGQMAPFAARVSEHADVKLYDGKVIPRGTPIIQALTIMGTSPGLWPDAMEFLPDRFNSEIDPSSFMPFGGSGKRICPGRTLLYTEMYSFIGNLLRNFTVSFPPGFDARVERISAVITNTKDDLFIVLTPRD